MNPSVSMTFVASVFVQFKARACLADEVCGMHWIHRVAPGRKTVRFIAVRDICIVPDIIR